MFWTIYDHPRDYPESFVLRRHHAFPDGSVRPEVRPVVVAGSADACRAVLPLGLVCLGRKPEDDPVILETWV